MTVYDSPTEFPYVTDGVTTIFDYTSRVITADDVDVLINKVSQATGYTRTLLNNGYDGVRITYAVAPAAGQSLTLRLAIEPTQLVNYTENDPFPAEVQENALDKLTLLIQRALGYVDFRIGSTLRVPQIEAPIPELPGAGTRVGKYVTFDANGNPTLANLLYGLLGQANIVGSIAMLRAAAAPVALVGPVACEVVGYYGPGDGGGGWFIWDSADTTADDNGYTIRPASVGAGSPGRWKRQSDGLVVDVRHFGAVGDGVTDDINALDAALAYCKAKDIRNLRGIGKFAVSRTWEIDDTGATDERGYYFEIHEMVPHGSFAAMGASVLSAQPLIGVGRNSATNQTNLHFRIRKLTGVGRNVCDGIGIAGGHPTAPLARRVGCSLCTFEIDNITLCNIAVRITGNVVGCPSNTFRGNGIRANAIGFFFDGGTAGGSFPIVEGQKIHYGFISSNTFGGIVARRDCRYGVWTADWDFNGVWLSALEVDTLGTPEFAPFSTITGLTSGASGEVLCCYIMRGKNYVLVMHRGINSANNASPFTNGETVVSGASSAVVQSIMTTSSVAATSFYFDIIMSRRGTTAGFHRHNIVGGYLGGIVGDLLFTCNISGHNNHQSFSVLNGVAHNHSTTEALIYDFDVSQDFSSVSNILEIGTDTAIVGRDYRFGANRVFGVEQIVAVVQQPTWTDIVDFSTATGLPNGRVVEIHYIGKNAADHHGLTYIYISDTGSVTKQDLALNGFETRLNGEVFQLRQGAQPSMNVLVTRTERGGTTRT